MPQTLLAIKFLHHLCRIIIYADTGKRKDKDMKELQMPVEERNHKLPSREKKRFS